ncbi:Hypothetical predicted protein [Paramuricea clavata]|uniref:Uncharacterized protein n=1 Tax=Paramuricea clavata TaxID=317549 RepID=A0A7D9D6Y0_PARCT|nr:Hypothetical predicted protein [Paramuricea clavata]
MASSTKTHYFETFSLEIRAVEALKKMLEKGEMLYYRYVVIPDNTKIYDIRDGTTMRRRSFHKLCGVIQFQERFSPSAVREMFSKQRIYLSALATAKRPIVLILMRLWIMCECSGLHYAETACSNTPIGFGGKKTVNEAQFMKPYIKALQHYKECDRDDFCYRDLRGARQICKFKIMLEKKLGK